MIQRPKYLLALVSAHALFEAVFAAFSIYIVHRLTHPDGFAADGTSSIALWGAIVLLAAAANAAIAWVADFRGPAQGFATFAASKLAFITMYFSIKLRAPQMGLDWAVVIFAGFTTGIFVWFLVWGHFQQPPKRDSAQPGT